MTSALAVAVHDLDVVQIGDLTLTVAPPTDRATLEIVVERDGELSWPKRRDPRPSNRSSDSWRRSGRGSTASWPRRTPSSVPPIVKQFVDGEGFAYLGRSHRLLVDNRATGVRLDRGRFVIPPSSGEAGADLMRDWYVATGRHWLRRRVRPWAARLALDSVEVQVKDLGFRWGSARPTEGPERINIHWSTLQLPPSLIDYVLVHELAHLREANHTPEFWSIVARIMPNYEAQKTNLAAVGRNIWLGATATTH